MYMHSLACPRLLQVPFSFSHPRPFYPTQIAQRAIADGSMSSRAVPDHPVLVALLRNGVMIFPGLFIEESKWEATGREHIRRIFADFPAVDVVLGLLEEPTVVALGKELSTHTCCVVFARVRADRETRNTPGASVRLLLAPF